MTDQEFESYLQDALANLKTKQNYLESEFGLGHYERFFIDYEKEELQFSDDGQVILAFEFTAVGSHVSEKNSWRWAWANSSLPETVRKKAIGVQRLFDLTGFDVFKNPVASVDEAMAWEFVALSCKMLDGLGAYSMRQQNLQTYIILNAIKKQN
jgi:hypothetical protein